MFNEKQRKFIQSLGLKLDFDNLTDDDLVKIEDAVAEKLVLHGKLGNVTFLQQE